MSLSCVGEQVAVPKLPGVSEKEAPLTDPVLPNLPPIPSAGENTQQVSIKILDGVLQDGLRRIVSVDELASLMRDLRDLCEKFIKIRKSGVNPERLVQLGMRFEDSGYSVDRSFCNSMSKLDLELLLHDASSWYKKCSSLNDSSALSAAESKDLRSICTKGEEVSFYASCLTMAAFRLGRFDRRLGGPAKLLSVFSKDARFVRKHECLSAFSGILIDNLNRRLARVAEGLGASEEYSELAQDAVDYAKSIFPLKRRISFSYPSELDIVIDGDKSRADAMAMLDGKIVASKSYDDISAFLYYGMLSATFLYDVRKMGVDLVLTCAAVDPVGAMRMAEHLNFIDDFLLARVINESNDFIKLLKTTATLKRGENLELSDTQQEDLAFVCLGTFHICKVLDSMKKALHIYAHKDLPLRVFIEAKNDSKLSPELFRSIAAKQDLSLLIERSRDVAECAEMVAVLLGYHREDMQPQNSRVPKNDLLTMIELLGRLNPRNATVSQ